MLSLQKTLLVCYAFSFLVGYSSSLLSQTSVGEYEYRIPPAIMPPMIIPAPSTKGEASANDLEAQLTSPTGRNRIVDQKLAYAREYALCAKVFPPRVLPTKSNSIAADYGALARTFRQLNQTCDANFDELPLGDALKRYFKAREVEFQVEALGLLPVSLQANGTKLRKILRDLLASANCEYFVLTNGVIFVRQLESTKE